MNTTELKEALAKALCTMSVQADSQGAAIVGNAFVLFSKWESLSPWARQHHFTELQNALARLNTACTTLGLAMSAAEPAKEAA